MSHRWTWHGGSREAGKGEFGGGDWIDLATGINPHPWPGAAMTFDWRRFPDPEHLARLERVAADYFGVGSGHVCAVPGSEIGLRLVCTLIGGAPRHVVPGYRTDRRSTRLNSSHECAPRMQSSAANKKKT